jgi:hypothetical protein
MSEWITFPYLTIPGGGDLASLLPIQLGNYTSTAHALIDSGASVNVLPYSFGLGLGLDWHQQRHVVHLGGILARHEARAVLLDASIEGFAPVKLAFAWSTSDDVRLILGQTNFFLSFDVQFRRRDLAFDIRRSVQVPAIATSPISAPPP